MLNLLSPFKSKIQIAFALGFLALFAINFYNLKGWEKANKEISNQNQTIKTLNEKIKGLSVIAQIERAQTIDAFDVKSQECANEIKRAVAASNIPPRERIVFKTAIKTQFITKELANETQCPNSMSDVTIADAFGLRDIQTARTNN